MLSTIQINDNFTEINAEYKRFKHVIYNRWCESNQYSLDAEEKKLLISIKLILDEKENTEENRIRALIGARTLSKYSIIYQEECVDFFSIIDSPFPLSIEKRRFFFKCIAKECKKNRSYIWDNYVIKILSRILPMNGKEPREIDSIENALIYIEFLFRYAPDFLSKFSDLIFLHLLKIVHENKYIFDPSYDILSKTSQTQDQYFSNGNTFFANNAIELMRQILLNIKAINHQSIKIDKILKWDQDKQIKSMAILSILLESCGKAFLKQNVDLILEFLNAREENQEIQCFILRNLIYCLKYNEMPDENPIQNLFSFDSNLNPSIICAKLQNAKLLLMNNNGNEIQRKIIEFASLFINDENYLIRNSAYDLLNTFCLYCDDQDIDDFISKSELKDQMLKDIHLEFGELAKLMLVHDEKSLIDKLSFLILDKPLDTLLFLNNNETAEENEEDYLSNFLEDEKEENFLIKNLKNQPHDYLKNKIIDPIFKQLESLDSNIRSLVPLVLVQISPVDFFSNEYLQYFFRLLLNDTSKQVKLAILQSFNNYLLSHQDEIYQYFANLNENFITENVLKPLLDDFSPRNIRIESIKFICLLQKKGIVNFTANMQIISHMKYYEQFSKINNNILIIPRKLADNSEYLPYLFESFPNSLNKYFPHFYNFSIDFMNITTNCQTNYKSRSHHNLQITTRTSFQQEFYETIFCSFAKAFITVYLTNPSLIQAHTEELINFCMSFLYYGVTERETESVLKLLEQCLHFIGLQKSIEINDQKVFDDTNLYKIVFNTGAHFISPSIKKHVFRILGFLGSQPLYEKPEIVNFAPSWKDQLKYQMFNISKDLTRRKIYYSTCSEHLFKILEDKTKSDSHLEALEALMNIEKKSDLSPLILQSEVEQTFKYFKEMLNNSNNQSKHVFIPLLDVLIRFNFGVILRLIPDLIHVFIDLWDFGSSSLMPDFAKILRINLSPYINDIIPLVLSLDDPNETVKFLGILYDKCIKNVPDNKIYFFDVVNLFIQMINEGKYEALNGLNEIIPNVTDLYEYMPSIIETCAHNLELASPARLNSSDSSASACNSNSNNNNDDDIEINNDFKDNLLDKKYLNDTFKVLKTLVSNSIYSDSTFNTLISLSPLITQSLEPFTDELHIITERINVLQKIMSKRTKTNANDNNKSDNDDSDSDSEYEEHKEETNTKKGPEQKLPINKKEPNPFDINEFIELVTRIRSFTVNEAGSLYVNQWLDDLVTFCIKNSPSYIIRSVFPVARNNRSFAYSVFNIAFYSCISVFITNTTQAGLKKPIKRLPPKPTNNNKKSFIGISNDPRAMTPRMKKEEPKKVTKTSKLEIIDGKKAPNNNEGGNEMAIKLDPSLKPKEIPFKEKIKDITDTFLALFRMEEMNSQCKTVLINLVEFLDHSNAPILDCNDLETLNKPITTIFSSCPPLALRFALLHHYELSKENANKKNIENEKKKAEVDLQQAFLNVGLLDQYQNFSALIHPSNNNNNDYFLLPVYTNTIESIHHIQKANDFFKLKDWNRFYQQIDSSDCKVASHLFKTASLIQQYWSNDITKNESISTNLDLIYNYVNHEQSNNPLNKEKLRILKEIENGFNSLGNEIGTGFSNGNSSVFQSIIYGQQLIELQEMFFSNGKLNNFIQRFMNSDQISNFLNHILLLRITTKGETRNSLPEKVFLLNLCRKSNKWKLMNEYFNYFYRNNNEIPIEVSYEMMYNKLSNNEAKKEEFDSLLENLRDLIETDRKNVNELGKEYEYRTLEKFIKYQQSLYYLHSNEKDKFTKVIELCGEFNDNSEAINLLSWANLKLYQLKSESNYLKEAIKGYIQGSLINEKNRVPNMISIISILFKHYTRNINEIKNDLNKIPLHYFIDPMSQIISYIPEIDENDEFGRFVTDLLIKIMENYPHGVIYDYSFSLFCDDRIVDNQIKSSPINKVKQYFIQHPEKLELTKTRNIFTKVTELTNSLYKVSSDIKGITLNFLKYAKQYIADEFNASHSNQEIDLFINDLEFINNNYFIPVKNYYNDINNQVYQPNEYEKADLDDSKLKKSFEFLSIQIHEIIVNFKILKAKRILLKQRTKLRIKNEIKLHKIEYRNKRKKNSIKPTQDKDLTKSTRVVNNQILIDNDENDLDIDKKDTNELNESNKCLSLIESSDSIEIGPNYSLEYNKKSQPILFIYDKNDKVENNIKKPLNKVSYKPQFAGFEPKPEPKNEEEKVKDIIMKLKEKEERYKRNIRYCLNSLRSLRAKLTSFLNDLKNRKDDKVVQHDILKDSPNMAHMINLCLPVFGTYKYNQKPILISRFLKKYVVLVSVAAPKKLTIVGDDGNKYSFMLKASEDLRIDQRNMILFRFLNKFLKTKIRTYSVTPLTVRFGIVQFVEKTTSLAGLISSNREKLKVKGTEIAFIKNKLNYSYNSDEHPFNTLTFIQKYENFNKVIDKYAGREIDLRESLWICAPNSEIWVKYIVNFSNTCAVTSMVGYIIGLGDRHIKNILVDQNDGSIMHIDFNDCFEINQQRSYYPEKVPFRLTRNMITAFGPCGCNGTFRSSCEETMELIRDNREIIYNVLEVFAISPTQSNGRVKDIRRSVNEINYTRNKNSFIMKRIEQKLNGTDRSLIFDEGNRSTNDEQPLSVHDQVDRLINRASNDYYLSASYTGWQPWI